MGGILAADPGEAEVREHLLQVGPIGEAVGEPARRAEACWIDADPRPQRSRRQSDVFADNVSRFLAVDQPRGTLEAELDVFRPGRQQVDVVVGVIADGMAGLGDPPERWRTRNQETFGRRGFGPP
jgi:hypothetical protein